MPQCIDFYSVAHSKGTLKMDSPNVHSIYIVMDKISAHIKVNDMIYYFNGYGTCLRFMY